MAVASAFASRDEADDPRVLVRDALHELGALEQVGEAVGLEHDGDDVGRVGLVELDEARWRARVRRPRGGRAGGRAAPLAPQLAPGPRELGALGVEVGLERLLAVLSARDVGLEALDPARYGGDVGRQHALACALWPPISDWLRRSSSGSCPGVLSPDEPSGSEGPQDERERSRPGRAGEAQAACGPGMLGDALAARDCTRFLHACRSFTGRA